MKGLDLNKVKFLLGAGDPEMDLIVSVLERMDYFFETASFEGKRVHPTNAYNADNVIDNSNVVFIECDIPSFNGESISIDHHNEGDYGYSLNHNQFLEAASVGQLFKLILNNDFHKAVEMFQLTVLTTNNETSKYYYEKNSWTLTTENGTVIIPTNIVVTAAIDHCSHQAYREQCLGVDSANLISVRIKDLAKNLSLNTEEIKEQLEAYMRMLVSKKNGNEIIDLTSMELGVSYSLNYLTLREASIITDTPIAVKTYNNEKCNGKIMFLSLSPEQVEERLNSNTFNGYRLTGVFGVPNRGYAGGMIA